MDLIFFSDGDMGFSLQTGQLWPHTCQLPPSVSALFSNQNLTHLCLSNNSLGTGGVQQLCQFLRNPECALPLLR